MECKDCPAINRCQDCGDPAKRAKYLTLQEASMKKVVTVKETIPFKVEQKKIYMAFSSKGLVWASTDKSGLFRILQKESEHWQKQGYFSWFEVDAKTVDASKVESVLQAEEKAKEIAEAEKELQDMQARVAELKKSGGK
jgi:hypothetical protein